MKKQEQIPGFDRSQRSVRISICRRTPESEEFLEPCNRLGWTLPLVMMCKCFYCHRHSICLSFMCLGAETRVPTNISVFMVILFHSLRAKDLNFIVDIVLTFIGTVVQELCLIWR